MCGEKALDSASASDAKIATWPEFRAIFRATSRPAVRSTARQTSLVAPLPTRSISSKRQGVAGLACANLDGGDWAVTIAKLSANFAA
jgi:hypothetical protein